MVDEVTIYFNRIITMLATEDRDVDVAIDYLERFMTLFATCPCNIVIRGDRMKANNHSIARKLLDIYNKVIYCL